MHLGFVTDMIDWDSLFGDFPAWFNLLPGALSTLSAETGTKAKLDKMITGTPWLQESSFLWSLIGFTIARTRTKSAYLIPDWYSSVSNMWLEQGRLRGLKESTMGRAAYSLVFAEMAKKEDLLDKFPWSIQSSLGIAFNALGYQGNGSALLERSLAAIASDDSLNFKPTESVVYGLLSAELFNSSNMIEDSKRHRARGLGLTESRNEAHLGDRFDSILVKMAVADTHIGLADYATAENLLNQVLSVPDLNPYTQIVTTLRLNKIGRRKNRLTTRLGDSLRSVIPLTIEADTEVQIEFLAELAATLAHLKYGEKNSQYCSELNDVVQQTIDLYQKHSILQDDWRFKKITNASKEIAQVISELSSGETSEQGDVETLEIREPIYQRILEHFVQSTFDNRPEHFLPEGSIDRILDRKSVVDAIGTENIIGNNQLVNFILKKARKLFLIAIYSGLEGETLSRAMRSFEANDLKDTDLPIKDLDHEHFMPSKDKVDGWPELWTPVTFYNLCQAQWRFLAPVFSTDRFFYDFGPRSIIPVVEKGDQCKEGSFSRVFKIKVHEAHFQDQKQSVRISRIANNLSIHK